MSEKPEVDVPYEEPLTPFQRALRRFQENAQQCQREQESLNEPDDQTDWHQLMRRAGRF